MAYLPRIVDDLLDHFSLDAPAVVLRGARAVGKSATATRRAKTVYALDDDHDLDVLRASPDRLATAETPILIDEWQRWPKVWGELRRLLDQDFSPNRFILTGSAEPSEVLAHPGAGRFLVVRMYPMSLAERGLGAPSVSLGAMLSDDPCEIEGTTEVTLADYADEIVRSGFPAVRTMSARTRQGYLATYLEACFSYAIRGNGEAPTQDPDALRRWSSAYAASISKNADWETIRQRATPGERDKPGKKLADKIRGTLINAYVIDPLGGWQPGHNRIGRLGDLPKHHFTDPALAARLLNANPAWLIQTGQPRKFQQAQRGLVGELFESLVVQSARVYAEFHAANVFHLRTYGGEREVDIIIERDDGGIVALEVKLTAHPEERDFRHLEWLRRTIDDQLIDAGVITTGTHAYRHPDNGFAVIPAALLGP